MPNYRCNMLDDQGGIVFADYVVAESLSDAITGACRILEARNAIALSRRVYAFDIEPDNRQVVPQRLPGQIEWRPYAPV